MNTIMQVSLPKISIVTPSYNQGEYLEQTILSVLNQNYPNLEYIIIDGSSNDNSVDIIKKYESRLSYWVSEPDNGLYHAIQKGFEKSSGEIMAWINSDDMYHSKALFSVAQIFTEFSHINWITGKNTYFDEMSRCYVYNNDEFNEQWSLWRLYTSKGNNFIQQESTFWRRGLWEKTGAKFNLSLKLAADFDLWLRFFELDRLYSTNMVLAGFRQRSKKQKSKDLIVDYKNEVTHQINESIKSKRRGLLLMFRIFALKTIVLIPVRKIRTLLIEKILDLPPKIGYTPNSSFHFITTKR